MSPSVCTHECVYAAYTVLNAQKPDRTILHECPLCFSLQVVQYYLATRLLQLIFDTWSVTSAASRTQQVSQKASETFIILVEHELSLYPFSVFNHQDPALLHY